MPSKIVRVWAKPETCLAHEACQVTPVFEMLNQRVAVAQNAEQRFVSNREWIIVAVMSCPTASLFIEFEDGKVISSADWEESGGWTIGSTTENHLEKLISSRISQGHCHGR